MKELVLLHQGFVEPESRGIVGSLQTEVSVSSFLLDAREDEELGWFPSGKRNSLLNLQAI